jgi:hypothetical protein
MKLEKKADGTYALQREARYAKILNLSEIPDLYVPYVHQNQRLHRFQCGRACWHCKSYDI